MTVPEAALLSDRGAVCVTGPDAEKLLQGLITNDVPATAGTATFAGLLSPQGKILFDFFVMRSGDGLLLEVARNKAADLAKRLNLYRLRSNVTITECSDAYAIAAVWGRDADAGGSRLACRDPRLAGLGWRIVTVRGDDSLVGGGGNEAAYHAHRIGLGVPEGGRDYAFGDTFPHEALFDQLNGVSFSKGCYVGQEIVSRMQHRGTARKRIVQVTGEALLPVGGCDVEAGGVAIGTLGSVAGRHGLALVRLDRAAEFKAKGVGLRAGNVGIALRRPAFATFDLEPVAGASALPP